MIYKFIEYLTALPSPTTAPLYGVVNTPSMLAVLGGVTEVKVYSTRPAINQSGVSIAPYVRLWDAGIVPNQVRAMGGSSTVFMVMMVECVADGTSASQAEQRAYYLAKAVKSKIYGLKGQVNLTLTDLGGSGSQDSLQNWIVEDMGHPVTSGGKDAKFVSYANLKVTCTVFRGA